MCPLLGVILLRWMAFHMPACASVCVEVVPGHSKLQDLCSEEQQSVQFSHDPSWSLKQRLHFMDSIPPSLCGV